MAGSSVYPAFIASERRSTLGDFTHAHTALLMVEIMSEEPFPGTPLGNGYYLVNEEQMKDFTFIRPGIVDLEADDIESAPQEPITPSTKLSPVDVIIFHEKGSQYPVDESGCNQWAFVVDEKEALYVRGRVRSIPLSKVHKLENAIVVHRIPEPLAKFVAPMLLRYRWRPSMFQVAINHLQGNNYAPFIYRDFFPPEPNYESDEEYELAWDHMVSMLEPRDAIFTFDRRSPISKLIAKVTHGPFSHCAVYAGDGTISEIVTSGTRMVPIETYKGRHYRLAVFRHYGKAPNTVAEMLADMRAVDGRSGYSYLGAFGAGVKALFGNHREAMAPNSLILSGWLTFITQV
jgi:hypothetical protein